MGSDCYWCAVGTADDGEGVAVGTCSMCWVFACLVHGERERGLGKWRCWADLAAGLSVAAGLDDAADAPEPAGLQTSPDLATRFPRTAQRTAVERARWYQRRTELARRAVNLTVDPPPLDRFDYTDERRQLLLADAVGITMHFLPPQQMVGIQEVTRRPPPVAPRLGWLVAGLEDV